MNRKEHQTAVGEGRLPSPAPLANGYVPFQLNDPSKYEPNKALVRGTLFPGLDLPFMGLVNKNDRQNTPLNELQAMGFMIQELALYLDTHADDREAFELYRNFQKLYAEAKETYEKEFGSLTHKSTSADHYKWLHGPWPWEYCKNKED